MCQGSGYASGSEYVRVLDVPQFSICQGETGFQIFLNTPE